MKRMIKANSLDSSKPWLRNSEWRDELDSVDRNYNDVRLTDEEFHEMYLLGYTLGTSAGGYIVKANEKDYKQYKSGKDVNGNPIQRDSDGEVIRVHRIHE